MYPKTTFLASYRYSNLGQKDPMLLAYFEQFVLVKLHLRNTIWAYSLHQLATLVICHFWEEQIHL